MRVASLDVGSNSVLMLVAELQPDGAWHRQEDHAEVTRISQGLDQSGLLHEEAIARTEAVLRRFVARARELQIDKILVTGTAPFRRAKNGAAVAEHLSQALGVDLVVATGDEEAALTLEATLASFPELRRNWLVDIGGASTEIIRCDGEVRQGVSLDVGVVRLTERHIPAHPIPPAAIEALRADIRAALASLALRREPGLPLVGVAGTVTTLAAVDQRLERWDPNKIQGYVMSPERIHELAHSLSALSLDERSRLPGLDPRRSDVAPAGAWLLYELCAHLGASEVVVSDRGLRWGRLFREGVK